MSKMNIQKTYDDILDFNRVFFMKFYNLTREEADSVIYSNYERLVKDFFLAFTYFEVVKEVDMILFKSNGER